MEKVKIGVLGGYRGRSMAGFCAQFPNAELVAVCDKSPEAIESCKEYIKKEGGDCTPSYYDNFEDFIKHDMDAVVLANYANEHAPFAIRCMKEGKHVISEVLPVQTLKEAVELVETVEKTGKIYAYAENYCYMPASAEIKRLYDSGEIGEFQYGEGEYVHDCHGIWPEITYGDKTHWRNNAYSTFYCTHSLGPIIHICGLRPISVVGFELPLQQRMLDVGCMGGLGSGGIEMVTLENGAVIKSFHGCGLIREPSSIWYSVYGKKGCAESSRWTESATDVNFYKEEYKEKKQYIPEPVNVSELSKKMGGHGGGDFYTMYYFVQKILGKPEGRNSIGIYEALDMFLPGIMAYKSILNGNERMEIPNLRIKAERDKYRNDTFCADEKTGGKMYAFPHSSGKVVIDDAVYSKIEKEFNNKLEKQKENKND